ncbi:chaperone NapD [Stieleria tagensis]|uniref:chaperone NapD n=1 Tax=Stieleria tagensis TaxID=2956795 RepID=UPI0036F1D569
MPISGLVVVFEGPTDRHADSLGQLASHPAIEVGQTNGHRCAIVIESHSKHQDQQLWEWVHSLPGVQNVSVAFVGFDTDNNDDNCDGQEKSNPTTPPESIL